METLTRTPHLLPDNASDLAPGERFTFDVWCDDEAPLPQEAVVRVAVVGPPEQRSFELDVWIAASAHFRIERLIDTLTLYRDQTRSTTLTFAASVVDNPPAGAGTVSALFSHEGRSCGQVTRVLPIQGLVATAPAEPDSPTDRGPTGGAPPGPPPRIIVRLGQLAPDLTIEILSPGQTLKNLGTKLSRCVRNGVRLGWLIQPRRSRVFVFRPDRPVETLEPGEVLRGDDVLPEFTLPLSEMFGWLG